MSDDLDLRAIHGRHEPDPRFVAALDARLEQIVAGSAPDDVIEGGSVPTIELVQQDPQRPTKRRRSRRVFGAAAALAAASVAVIAVVVFRDPASRDDVSAQQAGSVPNGWVAFTEQDISGDHDVYLVRDGEQPHRVAGADADASQQVCPAFSPDGRRLAFGQAARTGSGDEDHAELVIVEVDADGSISGSTTIPVEGVSSPPCPLWSPDGGWLAFGPDAEVVLVDTATQELRRLDGHAATDLEWLPGTDELAIADDGIHVYSVATGEVRSLDVDGVAQLAWSPDGTTVAFTRLAPSVSGDARYDATLWLADADGTDQRQVAAYRATHGIGPVWSPDGRSIAYQRVPEGRCCEVHEVVLVAVEDDDRGTPGRADVVISPPTTPGSDRPLTWYPWSVTWSPDGSMLLYTAWNDACASIVPDPADGGAEDADEDLDEYVSAECGQRPQGTGVLAVPVDTTQAPVVLADASWLIGVNDGRPWLPIQAWARQPLG